MSRDKKIIFDDGATVIEQTTERNNIRESKERMKYAEKIKISKEINVSDVIDCFAGYLIPRLEVESGSEHGHCIICGKETSKEIRKICFDCFSMHCNDLYSKSKYAVENGEVSVTIEA